MKGLLAKHFIKIFHILWKSDKENVLMKNFLMVWKFCKKQFSKGE